MRPDLSLNYALILLTGFWRRAMWKLPTAESQARIASNLASKSGRNHHSMIDLDRTSAVIYVMGRQLVLWWKRNGISFHGITVGVLISFLLKYFSIFSKWIGNLLLFNFTVYSARETFHFITMRSTNFLSKCSSIVQKLPAHRFCEEYRKQWSWQFKFSTWDFSHHHIIRVHVVVCDFPHRTDMASA